jgi:hypothetical protein
MTTSPLPTQSTDYEQLREAVIAAGMSELHVKEMETICGAQVHALASRFQQWQRVYSIDTSIESHHVGILVDNLLDLED